MVDDRRRGIGMAFARNGGYTDVEIGMLVMDFLTRGIKPVEPIEKPMPLDSIQPFLGYYRPMLVAARYGFLENLLKDVTRMELVRDEGSSHLPIHASSPRQDLLSPP